VAKLLVSVRSEHEALAALAGGAAIIDVKEPSLGSLGMASRFIWRRVRKALPRSTIVSVALGELTDWTASHGIAIPGRSWRGIDYRKVGLAGVGPTWREDWRALRERLRETTQPANPAVRPSWVAVVYLDWEAARAPQPVSVMDEAVCMRECAGVLFDTWDKSRRVEFDPAWGLWIPRVKKTCRFVALAGSLDEQAIRRFLPLQPDIFAVRGAACHGGNRNAPIDPERVARLVAAAGSNQ
jgi:(5-formylfuran-3-yl)methyl phosphate synthase